MKIFYDEECAISPSLLQTMNKAATRCVAAENLDPAIFAVSVSFVSLEEIHQLNRDSTGRLDLPGPTQEAA